MLEDPKNPLNIQEKKKEFERLLASPAWAMIGAAIQAQVDSMQREILFGTITDVAQLYYIERVKGMLEGRLSLQQTVMAMLEELEIDLQRANEAKEGE